MFLQSDCVSFQAFLWNCKVSVLLNDPIELISLFSNDEECVYGNSWHLVPGPFNTSTCFLRNISIEFFVVCTNVADQTFLPMLYIWTDALM